MKVNLIFLLVLMMFCFQVIKAADSSEKRIAYKEEPGDSAMLAPSILAINEAKFELQVEEELESFRMKRIATTVKQVLEGRKRKEMLKQRVAKIEMMAMRPSFEKAKAPFFPKGLNINRLDQNSLLRTSK